MLAVIKTGGKQYKAEKGKKFEVEKLPGKEGDKFTIEKVLLLKDGDNVKIGTPLVEGAYVEAKIHLHKLADKQVVFKMKAKKRERRLHGFRKQLTVIEILEVHATGGKGPVLKTPGVFEAPKVKPAKKPAAKKPAAKKA
jgi:large subunit ribosomal protein L21